ncbi:MAG: class F sortase [Flexilinea sp.]
MKRFGRYAFILFSSLMAIISIPAISISAMGYGADPGADVIVDNFVTVGLQFDSEDPLNYVGKTGDDVLLMINASLSETTIGTASSAVVKIFIDNNDVEIPTFSDGIMVSRGSTIYLKEDPESGQRYITFDLNAGESVNAQIFFTVPNGISEDNISTVLTTSVYDAVNAEISDASNVDITRKLKITWNASHRWGPVEETVSHEVMKINSEGNLPEPITYFIQASSGNTAESGVIFTKNWTIDDTLTLPEGISFPQGTIITGDGNLIIDETPVFETNCPDAEITLLEQNKIRFICKLENQLSDTVTEKQEISNPDIKIELHADKLDVDINAILISEQNLIRNETVFSALSFFDVTTSSSAQVDTVIPVPAPNISVTKTAELFDSSEKPYDPEITSVIVGDIIKYSIHVENIGALTGVYDIIDSVPVYTEFYRFEEGDHNGKMMTDGNGAVNVVWADESFAAGEGKNYAFFVKVSEQGDTLARIRNVAYASDSNDTIINSNTISHKFAVVEPGVRISKKALDENGKELDSILPEDISADFSYLIEVYNFGLSAANNRKIVDTLPGDIAFVGAEKACLIDESGQKIPTGNEPVYDPAANTVVWEGIEIPGTRGDERVVEMIVHVRIKDAEKLTAGQIIHNDVVIINQQETEDVTFSETVYSASPANIDDGEEPGENPQTEKSSLYLQKSVLMIGKIDEENQTLIDSDQSLQQYVKGSDDGIMYDIILWNDSESTKKLPVQILVDQLPVGFLYRGLTLGTDPKIGLDSIITLAESDPNFPIQSERRISRISSILTASYDSDSNSVLISITDPTGKPVWLEPGQGIELGMICEIETALANLMVSRNHIALGIDPLLLDSVIPGISEGTSFAVIGSSLAQNISETPKKLSAEESANLTDLAGTSVYTWYETYVNVAPAAIKPGIEKTASMQRHGSSSASVVEETAIGSDKQISALADVRWRITVTNNQTDLNSQNLPIRDYRLTDVVPPPYSVPIVSDDYPAGFRPEFSLYSAEGTLIKTIIIPETAQNIEYRTVIEEVGTETLTLQIPTIIWTLDGDEFEIPSGSYAVIDFWTIYNSPLQETGNFTNTINLTLSQPFDPDIVEKGTVSEDGKSISTSDTVFFRGAYQSFSYIMVTDLSETNSGSGFGYDKENNVIEAQGPGAPIEYTINITNNSSRVFNNLVVIDKLPAEGDFGNINLSSPRGSEYKVIMGSTDTLDVSVIDSVESGSKPILAIDSSHYRIEFTDQTSFTNAEWGGLTTGNFHSQYNPQTDTGFRIVFDNSVNLTEGQNLSINFGAFIGNDANAGETAWNTFGYAYREVSDRIVYVPEPTKVGVRMMQPLAPPEPESPTPTSTTIPERADPTPTTPPERANATPTVFVPTATIAITPTPEIWFPQMPETGFSAHHLTVLDPMPENISYKPTGFTLEIPILNVHADIVTIPAENQQWVVDWLDTRAGLLSGSPLPGDGLSYIAAHNHLNTTEIGPFLFIRDLQPNDRVFVKDSAGMLRQFSVFENSLFAPDDFQSVKSLAESKEGTLTLITCEDEDVNGGYLYRRVVFAEPVG